MYTYRRNGRPNPEGEPMTTTLGHTIRTFTFTFAIDSDAYACPWQKTQDVIDEIEDAIATLYTTTTIERGLVIDYRIDESTPILNRDETLIGMVTMGRIEYVTLGRTVTPEAVLCDLQDAIHFTTTGEVEEI